MKGAVAEAPREADLGALGLSLRGYGLSQRKSSAAGR